MLLLPNPGPPPKTSEAAVRDLTRPFRVISRTVQQRMGERLYYKRLPPSPCKTKELRLKPTSLWPRLIHQVKLRLLKSGRVRDPQLGLRWCGRLSGPLEHKGTSHTRVELRSDAMNGSEGEHEFIMGQTQKTSIHTHKKIRTPTRQAPLKSSFKRKKSN